MTRLTLEQASYAVNHSPKTGIWRSRQCECGKQAIVGQCRANRAELWLCFDCAVSLYSI